MNNNQIMIAAVLGLGLLVALTVTLILLNRPKSKYSCNTTSMSCFKDPKGKYSTLDKCNKACSSATACVDNTIKSNCNNDPRTGGCYWESFGLGGSCKDGHSPAPKR